MCRSCTRDEGRPFGVGFQERAPNHSKLLRSKAVVVSVGVKVLRNISRQVGVRETNESKPSDDASIRSYPPSKPGACLPPGTETRRELGYWASDGRRIGGVNLIRALVWNYGNQGSDVKGEAQVEENHEARGPKRNAGTDQPV